PADRITHVCSAEYVPDAVHPVWDQVVEHAVSCPEDEDFLRKWFGSACTGSVSEKAILLVSGPADSGKTTLTEAISEALGNVKESGGYSWQWSNSMIEKDEHGDSQATALSDTLGARL